MSRGLVAVVVVGLVLAGRGTRGQSISADQTVARLSDYVEQYYSRAQSIVTNESVTVQQINRDLSPDGFPRRLVYELRLEWDPTVEGDESPAKITRQLLTVNGRPPKKDDEPKCLDPPSVSPEPLAFLLPNHRHKFAFTSAGIARIDGRDALMVDYRSLEKFKATAESKESDDECIQLNVEGRSRGRLWADPETAAILRLDEHLIGMVDFQVPRKTQRVGGAMYMTLDRSDVSIRYRPVLFSEPDETILLPEEIITSWMWRTPAFSGTRITQSFSNYRRFVTAGRIIR